MAVGQEKAERVPGKGKSSFIGTRRERDCSALEDWETFRPLHCKVQELRGSDWAGRALGGCSPHSCPAAAKPFVLFVCGLPCLSLSLPVCTVRGVNPQLRWDLG